MSLLQMLLKALFIKQRRVCFLIVALLTFLSGCKDKPKKYLIGFSQCVESDAWRKTMLQEMKRELSFHPDLALSYKQADGNSEKQINQVKELLGERVDILIISPNEAEPLTPIVEEAFNSGIPVIVVDRKISSSLYTAYVGGDNYSIGKLAGEYAVKLLEGKGNIIEITGLPKSTPAIERNKGFVNAIKSHTSINVSTINGEWYKQKAKEELSQTLATSTNVDLVFAQNDVMALGAYEVFKRKGLPIPYIIGVDGLPCNGCGMQFVSEKLITASMLYPTGGDEAIRLAAKILNKEEFAKENYLQTTVIDSTNVRLLQLQASKITTQQHSIERQQVMLEQQRAIYKSQRNLLYVLALSLITAICFGAIAFYSLRVNRRINKQLHLQNTEILDQKNKIEEMSAKAQEANDAKVNFFTNISHEFRTPLTLILAPLEELLTITKSSSQSQSLHLIHKNVIRLLRLVNQLMDFRKIEVDKMRLRASENDIIAFLSEIIQSYKGIAQKRNIDLRMFTKERELKVWFDVNMLDKVVFNLLSNAFKFTKDHGYIHLSVGRSEEKNEVTIKVEDNGIGMSQEVVNKVFNLFFQGEYENHKGSGLGLALSKELIKLHKGIITVSSEKGKVTTFQIHLPLGQGHLNENEIGEAEQTPLLQYENEKVYMTDLDKEPGARSRQEGIKPEKEYSLLVIEDNEDLRNFLENKLGNEYEVVTADNSQSAVQQAFDVVPDLIISDIVIPGKDGMALVNIFKTDIRTSHIPIILLTGQTSIQQQIEGMRNMADAYITKPFNLQFLQQSIKSLLSNRAMLKEHFTSELPSNLKTQTIGKIDRKFVSEFTSLVESNIPNEEFSVEDICKSIGISRIQLYRKVKALLNVNVNDYILNTRLQKAKYLLQHEELNIGEVAYKVGFSSPAYFSTVFKSKFGVTPKAFKEK